jgi:hypothetical protein
MINLSARTSIEYATLLKWVIPNFDTAYLTDYSSSIVYNSNTYQNIGKFLSVSGTSSELKTTPSELSIALSGIPSGSISDILNQEIKGSQIEIYRAFYDPTTHALLSIADGNPSLRFKGIVTNYSISDDVDTGALIATTMITLTCNSIVEVLTKKVSGRRTNSADFPNESSMNRVQALSNSNFNFGAK